MPESELPLPEEVEKACKTAYRMVAADRAKFSPSVDALEWQLGALARALLAEVRRMVDGEAEDRGDAIELALAECERRYARKEEPYNRPLVGVSPTPPAGYATCSCVAPIVGSWTEIGADRIRLYWGSERWSSLKSCGACGGSGRVVLSPPPAPEVEPCPYPGCGGRAILGANYVTCSKCIACGPNNDPDAAKWNRVARAARSRAEPDDGWRPMESAPRDGTPVLIVVKGWSSGSDEVALAGYSVSFGGSGWKWGNLNYGEMVVAWRPLPAPPRGEK